MMTRGSVSAMAAAEAAAYHGCNPAAKNNKKQAARKKKKQFANPLMALLLVAGALTFMAYGLQSPRERNNLILASALVAVVSATCVMSYLQERSASNVMGE